MAETFVTIREKYEALKKFLLPGIFNLTPEDAYIAKKACDDLLAAIPKVSVTFDLEDDKQILINQIKIILRVIVNYNIPTYTTEVFYMAGENLYQIALDNLGDALRWSELARLNNMVEPYLTRDMIVKLPVKPPAGLF